MKLLSLSSFLLFSILSFGAEYNLTLTFTDGYTNEVIAGEKVMIEIVNIPLSKELKTDSKGAVNLKFEAEEKIQYFFRFNSGKYEFQTRERFLGDEKNISISFYLYPSATYEKEILENETKILSKIKEESADAKCIQKSLDKVLPKFEEIVNTDLQLPMGLGDYGFKATFSVQATFDNSGNPRQIKILESSNKSLDMEVIRLVRRMSDLDFPACDGDAKKTVTFPVVIDREVEK